MAESVTTWYEYETSPIGTNDWLSTTETADTIEGLQKQFFRWAHMRKDYDVRIVRKTLTVEVVTEG
jgi:hypothetical protein